MEKRTYPALGETVIWQTLSNGLNVAIVPRPGFTKKLCYFVTDFGASPARKPSRQNSG